MRHRRSLITQINSLVTNIGPPAGKPAPICGFTPSTSNRLPPTSMVLTRIGSLPGSVRLMPGRHQPAASREHRQRAVVHEVHRRDRIVGEPLLRIRVPQRDQAIGLRIGQRPQHDRIDDREHRRGGAGAEAEHEHRHDRKRRMLAELPHRQLESHSTRSGSFRRRSAPSDRRARLEHDRDASRHGAEAGKLCMRRDQPPKGCLNR